MELPAGGERERTFHVKLGEKKYEQVAIDKEIKSSFSYYRPNMDFNILNAEKKIAENKNRFLSQKRSEEELNKNLKDFGRMRAQYKTDREKKFELQNLINIYTNMKKIESPLLSKYRKNNFINKNNMPLLDAKEEGNQEQERLYLNRLSSVSLSLLSPFQTKKENKLEEKFYKPKEQELEYSYNIDLEAEKKKKLEEQKEDLNMMRKFKKRYTFSQIDIAKQFRRIDGDKIITNEAKNMDKKTKEILNNENENIKKINLNLKFKKLEVRKKLINDRLNLNKDEKINK